jgi:hypothetical protein
MIRKSVSLLLVLGLAVTLVALTPPSLQSSPGNNANGDADPTGLDNGNRITSERIIPMSEKASENAVERWIQNYVVQLALRSLGL